MDDTATRGLVVLLALNVLFLVAVILRAYLPGWAATVRVWRGRPQRAAAHVSHEQSLPPLLVWTRNARVGDHPALRARRAGVDELQIEDLSLWSERLK